MTSPKDFLDPQEVLAVVQPSQNEDGFMADEVTRKKFRKGAIVVPNGFFRTQYRSKAARGVVVGYPWWSRGVIVKWAELKTPHALHIDYLTLSDDDETITRD